MSSRVSADGYRPLQMFADRCQWLPDVPHGLPERLDRVLLLARAEYEAEAERLLYVLELVLFELVVLGMKLARACESISASASSRNESGSFDQKPKADWEERPRATPSRYGLSRFGDRRP